jgi:glycerol kinase
MKEEFNMEKRYVIAIDQGTTGTRVVLFNRQCEIVDSAYSEIEQIYPHPGWVEHNPMEYFDTMMDCMREVFDRSRVNPNYIASIGITCQRETTILWDKNTGVPVYNAIVWQSRQTAQICDGYKKKGYEGTIRERTGLIIDPYFSVSKIKWILENVDGVKDKVRQGEICMGTVDTWLIWKLSGGAYHVTDHTNASRTQLFNIKTLSWDEELFDLFGIPQEIMPKVVPSCGICAYTSKDVFFGSEVPIAGVVGDQQAATFGQVCFEPGLAKNTYGTSLAFMMNIGTKPVLSQSRMLTDLLWHMNGTTYYAFEAVIFVGGAAIQWLRDGLGVIGNSSECDKLARRVDDTDGVYTVPAFTGLGFPYWDPYARGLIIGITRGTKKEHVARSVLESLAYQTRDMLEAAAQDSDEKAVALRVDGGATKSEFLMQFQADILGIPVYKPAITEMAALGAAYMAGLGVGFWEDMDEISKLWKVGKIYEPKMSMEKGEELYDGWKKAIKRSLNWVI